jgi:hypothetical protein
MLLIVIGALIGVVKIVFAGVKYSLSDIITDKHDAKEDIMGVFLGLVLLLIPFIVLNTIYPDLTNLNILQPGSGKMPDNGSSGSIQTTGALDDQYELPRGQKKISCNNDRTDCAKLCERLNGVAARPADPSIQSIWTCIYTPRT